MLFSKEHMLHNFTWLTGFVNEWFPWTVSLPVAHRCSHSHYQVPSRWLSLQRSSLAAHLFQQHSVCGHVEDTNLTMQPSHSSTFINFMCISMNLSQSGIDPFLCVFRYSTEAASLSLFMSTQQWVNNVNVHNDRMQGVPTMAIAMCPYSLMACWF